MAYQKQKQQIGIGGISLAPPPDRINDTDSVVLQNWRVDQAGQLRSRKGMKHASAAIAGNGHTIFRGSSGRYAGVGGSLLMGESLGTSVATGFDGNQIGLAEYHNSVWAMNQAKQCRVAAGVAYNWSITAPAAVPTIARVPQTTSVDVADFVSAEGWGTSDSVLSYTPMVGAPQPSAATITVPAYRSSPYYLSAAAPTYATPPASISATEEASDYFTVWVCCSNPGALSQLDLRIGSQVGSVYGYATASILPAATGGDWAANTWIQLIISRGGDTSSIPNADSLTIPTFVPDQWFDWAHVWHIDVIANGSAACTFSIQQRLKLVRPNSGLTRTYYWYLQFGSSVTGAKSNAFPPADGSGTQATMALSNAWATLSGIPVSSDPQVDTVYIYRAGGNVDQTLLVGSVANGVTVFADTTSEADLQDVDVIMDVDNDPPPPCKGVVGPYFGKLVAWNSAVNGSVPACPQRYFWTPSAQPWKFPGSNDTALGNWEDCGASGEGILRITDHKTVLVFYKERSIWRLVGDPDTNDPVKTNANAGLLGAAAICSAGNLDYYGGTEGVFSFNGDYETDISGPIKPIFMGDWVDLGNVTIPPMNMAAANTACMAFIGGRLFFSYPEAGSNVPTVTLVYSVSNQTWYTHKLGAGLAATAFTALNYDGPGHNLCGFVSGASATLYELEQFDSNTSTSATTDDGNTIPLAWQTRYYDQGLPDNLKTYSDLVVVYRTAPTGGAPSTLNVSLIFDNGAEVQAVGTISSATRASAIFRLNNGEGFDAQNAAIRIDGNTSSQVTIFAVYLHYYAKARRAQSFDTGWINPSGPLVSALDRFEADILIPAGQTVTWELITELPGDSMAQRTTGTLTGDGTRKPMLAIFGSLIEGRRVRIVLTIGTAPYFQLWGFRLRYRPWGQYIDGAHGDVYYTPEIRLVA
jgi:hypothetical protein